MTKKKCKIRSAIEEIVDFTTQELERNIDDIQELLDFHNQRERERERDIAVVNFFPKKNKNVIRMSTLHHGKEVNNGYATGTTVSRQTVYRRLEHIDLYARRPINSNNFLFFDISTGRCNLVVMVMDSWSVGHELELSTNEGPPLIEAFKR
ncbi:hypothetical protein TNCV_3877931 [Trichonephila clavipes]|uniref:Uncharacterized protein n=1 Tax=Trichonephila clavipes TaxID=2585209 RepID=A0A8X6SWF7_TRICX|nr:hypothetical protein TNCV_3877931 [Trichonephila clavipes]